VLAGIYEGRDWLNPEQVFNRGHCSRMYKCWFFYIGLGTAQFLLVLANPSTSTPFMLVSGLDLAARCHRGSSHHTLRHTFRSRSLSDLYKNSPWAVAVTASGMISSTIFSMGPVMPTEWLGNVWRRHVHAVSILAAVLTQYPMGRCRTEWTGDSHRNRLHDCYFLRREHRGVPPYAPRRFPGVERFSGFRVDAVFPLAVSHVNDNWNRTKVGRQQRTVFLERTGAAHRANMGRSLDCSVLGRSRTLKRSHSDGQLTIYDLWRKTRRSAVPQRRRGRSSQRTHRG